MQSKTIQKYSKYSVSKLLNKCRDEFNKFIRNRDADKPCINCGRPTKLQAGHLFPTKPYSHLRFDEVNVNGECLHCNFYNSQSHSYKYVPNLIKRIGMDEYEKLRERAESRPKGFTWDRFTLIEKIEHYKKLNKQFK